MEQEARGKISIHQGKKNGEELMWSERIGEKDYLYYGETSEAMEVINWEDAEKICGKKLESSYALLFRSFKRKENKSWEQVTERMLLYFVEEEKDSVNRER